MELINKIENIKKKISGKILINGDLSKLSWFNIGGLATVLFKPNNLNELIIFLKDLKEDNNIKVIGAGSNILIRDGGFEGVIIKLGDSFNRLSLLDDNTLIAGASALDKKVSEFAKENSLSGFEFLSCIPGSIGGAIRMNSGCFDEDISKILISVQVLDLEGIMRVIPVSDIKFQYRGCSLEDNLIFVSATFRGIKDKKLNIEKKIKQLVEKKKKAQPSKIKTCGSTFKNPKEDKAWKLISKSGCAGMSVGDAYISEKHCNFFVNKGNASSQDLENLINIVKQKVLFKTGIELELELKIIGKKK